MHWYISHLNLASLFCIISLNMCKTAQKRLHVDFQIQYALHIIRNYKMHSAVGENHHFESA